MNDIKRPASAVVTTLIESFLYTHPQPTKANWKELIVANPAFAEDIADFAMWYGKTEHIDESAFDEALDEELFNATKSNLLSTVYTNTAPLEKAKVAFQKCKGPMARNIARKIGLGERVDLFDQVVSGEAHAPYVILKRLARTFSLQLAAVAELFALNFQNRQMQAFKSEDKPKVDLEPISWREAVVATGVKGEEAQRLLHLEKEME